MLYDVYKWHMNNESWLNINVYYALLIHSELSIIWLTVVVWLFLFENNNFQFLRSFFLVPPLDFGQSQNIGISFAIKCLFLSPFRSHRESQPLTLLQVNDSSNCVRLCVRSKQFNWISIFIDLIINNGRCETVIVFIRFIVCVLPRFEKSCMSFVGSDTPEHFSFYFFSLEAKQYRFIGCIEIKLICPIDKMAFYRVLSMCTINWWKSLQSGIKRCSISLFYSLSLALCVSDLRKLLWL